jgi:hypothetical protein
VALAGIIADIVADLPETLPGVTVASRIGERWATTHEDAPPRIVWAPQEDSFGPAVNLSENPRQLRSCFTRVVVHLWGAEDGTGSFAPTEALKNALVASIYRACHGYFEIGRGRWKSEDGSIGDAGGLYLLEVTFGIPITDVALPVVTVAAVQQGSTVALPSGDETDTEML